MSKRRYTILSLLVFVLPTLLCGAITFDGSIDEGDWGSALDDQSGGPTEGFGAGHEVDALYADADGTYLYIAVAGEIGSGNRILVFLDTKTGGYNTANFDRAGAPEGVDDFNSGTTFDSGFNADYCVVIGTDGSNYFFDLFTLSSSGTNNYIGDSGSGNTGSDEDGVGANPTTTDDDAEGFELRLKHSSGSGQDIEVDGTTVKFFVAYISDNGFLSNQFISPAGSSDLNYGSGAVSFGSAAPNPVSFTDSSLPVELASFSAESHTDGVVLTWATASEIENQGFIISRKMGRDTRWQELASFATTRSLNGQGSTTEAQRYRFLDDQVREGMTYQYLLTDVDYRGTRTDHRDKAVTITYSPVADREPAQRLQVQRLYPNPFNPVINIQYDLLEAADVRMNVYDLSGQLMHSQEMLDHPAGTDFQIAWQGTDLQHAMAPAGIYLLKFEAGDAQMVRKVTLLR